jgi:hypothetical protein
MMNNSVTALEAEVSKGAVDVPSGSESANGEAADTTSPESINPAGDHELTTQEETTTPLVDVTTETDPDTAKVEAVPSVRDKILAARKAPDEVAQLLQTKTEQLSVPVYKRPPDSAFWRVRREDGWDPEASEVLLLPRKDGGGGPEFLLVLPELEPTFSGDPRLRNLVRYYYLAFITDARGRVGWWAVPSRSENDWHASARAAMRRLMLEWGMMKSDMSAKGYKLEKPQDNLGEPVWPAGSHDEWYVKGLSDKLLDSEDHPVLRELQGRK